MRYSTILESTKKWMSPYGYTHDLPAEYDEMVIDCLKTRNELIAFLFVFYVLVACNVHWSPSSSKYLRNSVSIWKSCRHNMYRKIFEISLHTMLASDKIYLLFRYCIGNNVRSRLRSRGYLICLSSRIARHWRIRFSVTCITNNGNSC